MTEDDIPVRSAIEGALYEIKRVIVGQDAMLERLLVALLAGGHVLLEGVPGLAKTLTVRTLADVLGGSFRRIQFTPDLVPADLVGTRIYRPDSGRFDTELGPVFGNFLLADEINRAPAKVQSALLEVMQERQVTIGGETHPVPSPFLVLATQNPIESEGTYPLPEAQVDRFLLKLLVDYPDMGEEAAVVGRSLAPAPAIEERLSTADLERFSAEAKRVFVDREVIGYAVQLADATRHPDRYGLAEIAPYIEYGSIPARADRPDRRGAGAGAAARAPARDRLRRARPRARRAAPPAGAVVRGAERRRVARRSARPPARRCRCAGRDNAQGGRGGVSAVALQPPAGRQGPGPMPGALLRALDLALVRRAGGVMPGDHLSPGAGAGTELVQLRPYQVGDDVRQLDPRPPPARASRTSGCRCPSVR